MKRIAALFLALMFCGHAEAATLYLSEFVNGVSSVGSTLPQIYPQPSITDQTVALSASSAQSAAFGSSTRAILAVCDEGCSVLVGTNPTATTSNYLLFQGQAAEFAVAPGQKIAVVANAAGNSGGGGGLGTVTSLTPGSANIVLTPNPITTTGTIDLAANITVTTIDKVTITTPATGSTLTIANGKTGTFSNSITIAGTDGSTLNVGAGGTLGSNAFTSTGYLPLTGGTLSGTLTITPAVNTSALTVTGHDGGGNSGTHNTAVTIGSGSALLDVGLLVNKTGTNAESAFDLANPGSAGGRMMRVFSTFAGVTNLNGYIADNGQPYFGFLVLSGHYSGSASDLTTSINPATNDPSQLNVWSDITGPVIQARSNADAAGERIFDGLNAAGNYVFSIGVSGQLQWGAGATYASQDTFLGRRAAATLRLGAADAASPVAQTLTVQNVIAGTSNTAGAALTIAGSQGTGTGQGGSLIFQVASAGSTGSAVNALATALTIASTKAATFVSDLSIGGNTNGGGYISSPGGILGNAAAGVYVIGTGALGFTSGGILTAPDLTLFRDAANTLAQRNGVNAQADRVAATFTDASDYAWAGIVAAQTGGTEACAAVTLCIGSYHVGTTTPMTKFRIDVDGVARADYGISAAATWSFAGNLTSAGIVSTALYLHFTGNGYINPISNGLYGIYNEAGTGVTGLEIGPTGTAYVRLAPTGVGGVLQVKLADGSLFSPLAASAIISSGAVPTLALAGGTCAGTVIAGGSTAGTVTLTGACVATNTLTLSVMPTAPTGYSCDAVDRTLGVSDLGETSTSATTAVFTFGGTTGATDVIQYKCIAY